jgi:hypothetical protein
MAAPGVLVSFNTVSIAVWSSGMDLGSAARTGPDKASSATSRSSRLFMFKQTIVISAFQFYFQLSAISFAAPPENFSTSGSRHAAESVFPAHS